MWIKQRNAACERLLVRWAEPLSAIAETAGAPLGLHNQSALVKQAWRYLLQNHPHDSICGCSIDQVHREMDIRFDWVEQIGQDITSRCLEGLAAIVDTTNGAGRSAVVVFNPTTRPRTDLVRVAIPLPGEAEGIELVSEGQTLPSLLTDVRRDVLWQFEMPVDQLQSLVGEGVPDEIQGQGIQTFAVTVDGTQMNIDLCVARGQPANLEAIQRGRQEVEHWIAQGRVESVRLLIHRGVVANCAFVAQDVPGLGYRTYWLSAVETEQSQGCDSLARPAIENKFLRLTVSKDGTCTLVDKRSGTAYDGLNRFIDVGDRGDEYNFCPVEEDQVVSSSVSAPSVSLIEYSSVRQTIQVQMTYRLPAQLGADRRRRGEEWVDVPIETRLSLSPGVPRLDIETIVENSARDHRLRVHFPVPVSVDRFETEGHFDVISREIDLPQDTEEWVEQPAPTHPQRRWVDVSDGAVGLMIANRGLPEVEVMRTSDGSEVALTLLRCVGWLSRGDLSVRQGHAGPGLPTPEAQCIGRYSFDYAVIPHSGRQQAAIEQAHAFAVPLRAIPTYAHGGPLGSIGSFVRVKPEQLEVSTVKESEGGKELVVRLWNVGPDACRGEIRFWQRPHSIVRCNLGERALDALPVRQDGSVSIEVAGKQIVTLLVGFGSRE
jgi:alpha-mannosidase